MDKYFNFIFLFRKILTTNFVLTLHTPTSWLLSACIPCFVNSMKVISQWVSEGGDLQAVFILTHQLFTCQVGGGAQFSNWLGLKILNKPFALRTVLSLCLTRSYWEQWYIHGWPLRQPFLFRKMLYSWLTLKATFPSENNVIFMVGP